MRQFYYLRVILFKPLGVFIPTSQLLPVSLVTGEHIADLPEPLH